MNRKLACALGVGLAGWVLCSATNEQVKASATATNGVAMAETCTHVRKLLDRQQLKYAVASDGSYVTLNFGYEKNRSQMLYVDLDPKVLDGYRTILVTSAAYRGNLMKPMLLELLRDSSTIGFWHVERDGDGYLVLFSAQVAWDISAQDLETCCRAVAKTADDLEERWADVDRY